MEINIPENISALRIKDFKHVEALDEIQDKNKGATISEMVKINSLFTDISIEDLRNMHVSTNNEIYSLILKMLDTYHPKPMPPAQVFLDGTPYVLIKDFTKLPTGWFVDVDAMTSDYEINEDGEEELTTSRMKEEPQIMAAFCYIEKGMTYAQIDQHKNIINPIGPRAKVFEEHFQLNHFIDLTTFFLRIYVEWKGSSIRDEKKASQLKHLRKTLDVLSGSLQSMQ